MKPGKSKSWKVHLFAALFVATLGSSQYAKACAFDLVKPERTVIDWIVESDTLVLARPEKGDPFSFAVVKVLAGTETPPPIPYLVESSTRRKLANRPEAAVLFARTQDSHWRRVAFVDEGFAQTLEVVLNHREAWSTGMPQSRIDYIESLQDRTDPLHKTIVISELDKVPYEKLRAFDLRISANELLSDLWTPQGYTYQAIRALLLGFNGSDSARLEIRRVMKGAGGSSNPKNLGAFSAAFIETEGMNGVSRLARDVLLDPEQPLEVVEQVVMALSVHHAISGQGVRNTIDVALSQLVSDRPEAGALVAKHFTLRANWSQADVLRPLIRDRKLNSTADLFAVAVYLERSRTSGVAVREDG